MKMLRKVFIFFITVCLLYPKSIVPVSADSCNPALNNPGSDNVFTIPQETITFSSSSVVNGSTPVTDSSGTYFIEASAPRSGAFRDQAVNIEGGSFNSDVSQILSETYLAHYARGSGPRELEVRLIKNISLLSREVVCRTTMMVSVIEQPREFSCNGPRVNLSRIGTEIVNVAITVDASQMDTSRNFRAYFQMNGVLGNPYLVPLRRDGNTFTNGMQARMTPGTYTLVVTDFTGPVLAVTSEIAPSDHQQCVTSFNIPNPITTLPEDKTPDFCGIDSENCVGEIPPFDLCKQAGDFSGQCNTCLAEDGIWTAVGCINFSNPTETIRAVISIGLGIGGGVVILMILAGSFLLSTSQGDPNRVKEAKELISSAIIGLVFIIFSITILRFIGVILFRIPGFGE